MTEDIQGLYAQIAELRRIINTSHRMGTVHKSKDGKVRVKFQKGDVGDEKGDHTSTWIRTDHGGAMSEGRQYVEGETVHVLYAGGNPEHAKIMPGGFSNNHPNDENSKTDNSTRRWRKPPEADGSSSQQGNSGASTQYGKDESTGQKWKDDKDDHQEINTFDKRHHKIGDAEYIVTKDAAEIKHGKRSMKVDKDSAVFTDGSATVKIKGGKIYLIGEVYLGSEDAADRVATEKTKDSRGLPLQEPFSTKAKAT